MTKYCESHTVVRRESISLRTTVCPKVPEKNNVPCFSAICAWILNPFDLQIAMMVRFVMKYVIP